MSQIGFYLVEIWVGGGTKGRLLDVSVADRFSVFSEFLSLLKNFISRFENVWFIVNLSFYVSEN